MGCCGCNKKIKIISEDENLSRLKNYINSLQPQKCGFCGGILRKYPSGIIVCTRCRKRN